MLRFFLLLCAFVVFLSSTHITLASDVTESCVQLPDAIIMSGELPEGREDLTFKEPDMKTVYNWLSFNIQLVASGSLPVGFEQERYKKLFTDKGWAERNAFMQSMMTQYKKDGQTAAVIVRSFLESAPRLGFWEEKDSEDGASKQRFWYFSVPLKSSSERIGVITPYRHIIVVALVYSLADKTLKIDGWEIVAQDSWKKCKDNYCRQLYRYYE